MIDAMTSNNNGYKFMLIGKKIKKPFHEVDLIKRCKTNPV